MDFYVDIHICPMNWKSSLEPKNRVGMGDQPETLWVHLDQTSICRVYLGGHPETGWIQNAATNSKPAPEPTQATRHTRPTQNRPETHTRNARRTHTTKPPQKRPSLLGAYSYGSVSRTPVLSMDSKEVVSGLIEAFMHKYALDEGY